MKALWKKLLALALAAVMVLAAVPGLADDDAMELAKKSFGDIDPNAELEPWQQLMLDYQAELADYKTKYAPEVRTLDNGVQVQRTPADGNLTNTKVYDADKRGCAACHYGATGLAEMLNNMSDLGHESGFWYGHHDLTNELGIEITYLQCLSCHQDSNSGVEMSSLMHAAHRNSAAFEAMGGDCWSCHFVDERTGEFVIWDDVKYDVLLGVNKVADVQGEFSYEQDVLSKGEVFSLNALYTWNMKDNAGQKPDPENDGVYDQFEITVNGMVENPITYTLRELIENAPSETRIGTFACEINSFGGPLIASFEFTGIPVQWLFEQSVPTAEANAFKNEFWGGPWSFEYLEMFPSYLVYEINGEPLSYKEGYPVMLYNMNGGAGKCIKNVTNLQLIHLDDPMAYYDVTFCEDYKIEEGKTMHQPNVGLCNLPDGLIIPAGEPHTFEGYAFGSHFGIDAMEFSMDGGETWTRFDTAESEEGKWLYWNFTWTPEDTGSYVLSVRAFDRLGRTFDVPNEKLFNVQ